MQCPNRLIIPLLRIYLDYAVNDEITKLCISCGNVDNPPVG